MAICSLYPSAHKRGARLDGAFLKWPVVRALAVILLPSLVQRVIARPLAQERDKENVPCFSNIKVALGFQVVGEFLTAFRPADRVCFFFLEK